MSTPSFRSLTRDECDALLARHHVGRVAFTFHDRVDIEPISYIYEDGVIYLRTSPGSKLLAIAHHPWVAFEVDEVRGPLDWQSVVLHGTVKVLEPDGNPRTEAIYAKAVRRLRSHDRHALESGDPVPFRDVVLSIYATEITGRTATTRTASTSTTTHHE